MKYKIVLTASGRKAFVGGNREVMRQVLITFEAASCRHAVKRMEKLVRMTLGSASYGLFDVRTGDGK
jgi:hypothetical protein